MQILLYAESTMTTSAQNTVTDRTSIAVTKDTLKKIKPVAKDGGIKVYETIEAMAEVLATDQAFRKKVVELGKQIAARNKSEKKEGLLSQKVSKLPKSLQAKLKTMSPEQLEKLLEQYEEI